ncbi:MAG TPA: hypothetical protein VM848_12330 [Acidimicrobiia bacterium]|nr:hypothetical protein [Acidimicrobiia bacterium]
MDEGGPSLLGWSQGPTLFVGLGVPALWLLGVVRSLRNGRKAIAALTGFGPPMLAFVYAQAESAKTGLTPQPPSEPYEFLIVAAGAVMLAMGIVGGLGPSRRLSGGITAPPPQG